MSASLRRHLRTVRATLAYVLIVASAGLFSWAGFVIARGAPGECGGDAPPCPPGFTSAMLGLIGSVFLLLPLGIWLAGARRPETAPAAIALACAGAATGIFSSRYLADPITDATSVTLRATAILGGIALLAAAIALLAVRLRGRQPARPDATRRNGP